MEQDSSKLVSKSALLFLSGTALSRVTGMFRDMAMAFCFGSHPAIAAFMVAFRLSNLMRRLFGEGPLPSGFIPHFESTRSASPEKGAQFFRDFFSSLTFFLLIVITLLEGGLLYWFRAGLLSKESNEILYLTMLMLPGLLFICLFGLSSALLQCEKKYFLSGLAPVAFNLIWIGAVFYLRKKEPADAAAGLSIAVVIAFFMQWLVTAPHAFRFLKGTLGMSACFRFRLFPKEIRIIAKSLLWGIIGVGAVQINSALDGLFARFASLEGPAYLWYAIRLQQLPLALFGIALSSALLPPLARAIGGGSLEQFRRLLNFALSRSFSLILPCMVGILVVGCSAVNLIYGRGDFDGEATFNTLLCLWGYGLGLLPSVFVLLLAPAFYAQKDYRTPMIASLLSVALNVLLNAFLVFVMHWGAFSIALATSLSSVLNCLFLGRVLSRKVGTIFPKGLLVSFLKTTLCALLSGSVTLLLGRFFLEDPTLAILFGERSFHFARELPTQLLQLSAMGGGFLLQFLLYAWAFESEDVLALIGYAPAAKN